MLELIQTEKSLTLELPYRDLANGTVFNNRGVLEFGFEVKPIDSSLYSQEDIANLERSIMDVLRFGVPEGERLRVYGLRMTPDLSILDEYDALCDDASAIAQVVNAERIRALRQAQEAETLIDLRMFVTMTLTYNKKKNAPSLTTREYEKLAERAKDAQENLYDYLKDAGYKPRAMRNSAVLELMRAYWGPGMSLGDHAYQPQTTYLPHETLKEQPSLAPLSLRRQALVSDVKRYWNQLRVGDQYVRCVAAEGPFAAGSEIESGMIAPLLNVSACKKFIFCLDVVHEIHERKMKALAAQGRRLYASTNIAGDYTDPAMAEGNENMKGALHVLNRTGQHVYRCSVNVWLIDDNEKAVKTAAVEVSRDIRRLRGLVPHALNAGLLKMFKENAPFRGETSHIGWDLIEDDAQTLFPSTGMYKGSGRPRILFDNRYDGLTVLDLFNPKLDNWNTIVAGKSGSGKTFQVQSILLQLMRSSDVDLMIIDMKRDYWDLFRAFDGAIIPFGPGTGVHINPFDLPADDIEPDAVKKAFLKAFVRTLVPYDGKDDTSKDNIIVEAIEATYKRSVSYREDAQGKRVPVRRTVLLSDFRRNVSRLEKIGGEKISDRERELAAEIASQLAQWTGKAANAELFDRPTNVKLEARAIYFDASILDKRKDLNAPAMLLMNELIWTRVKQRPERYKVVVTEEFATAIKNKAAADFAKELYALARTYNTANIAVTQSLKQYRKPEAEGILENTSIHLLMKLNGEDDLVEDILDLPPRAVASYRDLKKVSGKYSEMLLWLKGEEENEGGIVVNRPEALTYNLLTSKAHERRRREKLLEGARSGDEVVERLRGVERFAA